MSTLKISRHSDVPTALDLVKDEVGQEAKRIIEEASDGDYRNRGRLVREDALGYGGEGRVCEEDCGGTEGQGENR